MSDKNIKKVSILVRTCGRPEVLRECLHSIANQKYDNYEVVIIEDGAKISKNVIDEFCELDIKYHCNGKRMGRVHAGNKALELATGEYCIFLDDDDLIYDNHLQVLVEKADSICAKVVYSVAEEAKSLFIKPLKKFITIKKIIKYREPFNRIRLFYENYFPIQSVMFSRELFLEYGGFREDMDCLEDWDLWVRYGSYVDFNFINEVTSLYRVPIWGIKRQYELDMAYYLAISHFENYQLNQDGNISNREIFELVEMKKNIIRRKIRSFLCNMKNGIMR